MKKCLLAFALIATFAGLSAAEAETENPLAYLNQMRIAITTRTPDALTKVLDSTKAGVIATRNNDLACRWATLKTLIAANADSTLTFARLYELLQENLNAVGARKGSETQFAGFLLNPDYSKTVTVQKVNEAWELLKGKNTGLSFADSLIAMNQKERALSILKGKKGYGSQKLYLSTVWADDPDAACDDFMEHVYNGTVDPATAKEYVNKVLERLLIREDLDKAAFKKKLQIVSLMYNNRMTDSKKRAEWGVFTAIVQNTVEKL